MKSQKKLIKKRDWDCLIVLDACRYDYFEKHYQDYLKGDLKEVESEGSSTLHWLNDTFDDFVDVTYYSANPFVNSIGKEFHGFKATEHFSDIIDVWDFGWEKEKGGVPPNNVNEAYSGDNPAIIHYLQPHRPYLTLDEDSSEGVVRQKLRKDATMFQKLRSWLGSIAIFVFGEFRTVKLSEFIRGRNKLIGWSSLVHEMGAEKIIKGYKRNLEIVFESVSELVDELDGKIVVTADHGELFGKKGYWGHPARKNIPELHNVPWLEVEK